jgi:hypothetical protein
MLATPAICRGGAESEGLSEVDTMEAKVLVHEIIEAHGGAALWNNLAALEAEISAWGFLFTAKRRPPLERVVVSAWTRKPRLKFHDFPAPGLTGELIGDQEVRILGSDGNPKATRLTPRSAFTGLRRRISRDALDFIYFGGYALWNYLVTPFLFLRKGVQFQVLEPWEHAQPPWLRLQVTFPSDVPTHCRKQVFYFDEPRHLRRLDYTAEVVGRRARAAHLCENYQDFDGLKAPTRRRVRPILFGSSPLPAPNVVAIEVHTIRPVNLNDSSLALDGRSML